MVLDAKCRPGACVDVFTCCGNTMSLGAVWNLAVFALAFPISWTQPCELFHIVNACQLIHFHNTNASCHVRALTCQVETLTTCFKLKDKITHSVSYKQKVKLVFTHRYK